MQQILVVDDDRVQVDVVEFLLRRAGFEPLTAFDAATAALLFDDRAPDLVILDVQLGDSDGRDLLRQFRKQRPEVRILMLTALNAEEDRVLGLELGADDYLTKPFGHRELIARVRALLRREASQRPDRVLRQRLQVGSLVLDPMTHEVTRAGQRLDLSPTEFRLLQTLMEHPNVLVTTRTLITEVWGHQDMTARSVLRVTASRLRAKIEPDPANPRLLQTVPGEGLILRSDEEPTATQLAPTGSPVALEVVAELRELMGEMGNQPLQHLNEVFMRSAEKHISAMRKALTDGDGATLSRNAHRLRGSSGSVGAQRVASVCAVIEQRSRSGDLAPVGDLLQQLEEEIAEYEKAIALMFG